MRSLLVVATTLKLGVNRFQSKSLGEAVNLRDFLRQTGDYRDVAIYELEKSVGPLQQWSQLEESPE